MFMIISTTTTDYLLDIQRGLTQIISATTTATAPVASDTQRFVHTDNGLHSWQNSVGAWFTPVMDGLGSVRGEVGASLEMGASMHYAPYGTPFDEQSVGGFEEAPFGFYN